MHVSAQVRGGAALLIGGLLCAGQAVAEIAISANDQKVKLVNGAVQVQANPAPDNITIYDVTVGKIKFLGTVDLPTSVVGPPLSVAIAPDESIALVTGNMKIDPKDPTKTVPDNVMSVVDLKDGAPKVIATVETGKGPAGVSINRQGTLALVANRNEGTVSVYAIAGKALTPAGKVALGDEKSGPSHAAFTPDGTMALVTRDGDNKISVLSIEGTKVEYTKRDISAGMRPYGLDISSSGKIAVVANIGTGGGDADTASVIDLTLKPPRVVETFTVGQTPEGVKISPDGQWLAVTVMNGSNKPASSPFYNDHGFLQIYRINGTKVTKVAQAPIGHWTQGPAFSSDNKTILVSTMVEEEVTVFSWNGKHLKNTGHPLKVKGGAAAVRFADKPVAAAK
jgi:DNA-binding beta-propeller fold protein YncE